MAERAKSKEWRGRDSAWARYTLGTMSKLPFLGFLGPKSQSELIQESQHKLIQDLKEAEDEYQQGVRDLRLGATFDADGHFVKVRKLTRGNFDDRVLDASSMFSQMMSSNESAKNFARSQMSRAATRTGD